MRKFGLGLALVAGAQLTVLSSPALADDAATSSVEPSPPPAKDTRKHTTGWILLGAGGAVAIGGIVLDVIGAGKNQVSGQGGASDTSTTQNTKTDLLFAGSTMIIAGVVAGIYGGSLLVASSHQADPDAAREVPPATGSVDGVTKTVQASLASSPSFVLPVVGARF